MASARDFVLADKPADMLANYSKISLAEADAAVKPGARARRASAEEDDADEDADEDDDEDDAGAVPPLDLNAHPSTTPEIRALVEDLRVLGKKEFKILIKWCVRPCGRRQQGFRSANCRVRFLE